VRITISSLTIRRKPERKKSSGARTDEYPHSVSFCYTLNSPSRRVRGPFSKPSGIAAIWRREPLFANGEQFHIKNQYRIGRDCTRSTNPITQVRRNSQLAFAANLHSGYSVVPALNHASGA
jgi:hypothetical protein